MHLFDLETTLAPIYYILVERGAASRRRNGVIGPDSYGECKIRLQVQDEPRVKVLDSVQCASLCHQDAIVLIVIATEFTSVSIT